MAGKNLFNLSDKNPRGPGRIHAKRIWTLEDQQVKLKDYLEIPRKYWHLVKYGIHVRYVTTDNQFRSGGFVVRNPHVFTPRDSTTEKTFISLQNGFNKKKSDYRNWVAAYEDIEYLFAKQDAFTATIFDQFRATTTTLDANIRRLADYAKHLEQRIATMEKK